MLSLRSCIDLNTLIDDLRELLDLLNSLLILLFHLTYYLQWPVLLTEDSIVALPVDPLNFEEIAGSSSTLYVERNHASGMLALDAGSRISLSTYDAL